ncbi:MAG: hypothetical protein IJX69_02930 [Oscillospiraceae bacterium]|nr:hypothetical protein [Oscillospiraceae bacterium]
MSDKHNNFHHSVGKVEHVYRRILHILELVIAGIIIVMLVAVLGYNTVQAFYYPTIFEDTDYFLHSILTVVVGLEFVRMLIDMTPANTLEVLIMATARYIIMNHDDPLTLLIGVVCVGGLFAIRRFLIPHNDLTLDLVEIE